MTVTLAWIRAQSNKSLEDLYEYADELTDNCEHAAASIVYELINEREDAPPSESEVQRAAARDEFQKDAFKKISEWSVDPSAVSFAVKFSDVFEWIGGVDMTPQPKHEVKISAFGLVFEFEFVVNGASLKTNAVGVPYVGITAAQIVNAMITTDSERWRSTEDPGYHVSRIEMR